MLELYMYMEHNMKIKEKIYDATTGEETIIERDETAAETKSRLDIQKKVEANQAEAETEAVARQAILDRLGITADELKTILG
jgi:hypothetical protein